MHWDDFMDDLIYGWPFSAWLKQALLNGLMTTLYTSTRRTIIVSWCTIVRLVLVCECRQYCTQVLFKSTAHIYITDLNMGIFIHTENVSWSESNEMVSGSLFHGEDEHQRKHNGILALTTGYGSSSLSSSIINCSIILDVDWETLGWLSSLYQWLQWLDEIATFCTWYCVNITVF